ncbi:PHD finger protein 12 [Camelus dromedarius]|uniref:PHD finger protein 12 n=1 Tax=Camelus dromedarius TaxID=9838 RepID=A0A5N4D6X4_CAMDR|nr:PHD finger protein 12 [Camelus dromedarius]
MTIVYDLDTNTDSLDTSANKTEFKAIAHARILERRASRPGMPISNASTETPTSEQNDVDEEPAAAEPDYVQPQLRRSFELLTAAAMGQNPTQFQLPRELICTTALPGSSKTRRKEESTGENTKTQPDSTAMVDFTNSLGAFMDVSGEIEINMLD